MKERRFRLYAPLLDFIWEGDIFAFAPKLEIKRVKKPAELGGMDDWLSAPEWDRASDASHWLVHEHTAGAVPHAGEVENLVLLSLWLVKATKTRIAHRFKVGVAEAEGENGMSRLLDRFIWVPGSIDFEFSSFRTQIGGQSVCDAYAGVCSSGTVEQRIDPYTQWVLGARLAGILDLSCGSCGGPAYVFN